VIHIVLETSLPAHTVPRVRALLAPEALPKGVSGYLEEPAVTGLCAGPTRGGKENWVPCWLTLQGDAPQEPGFAAALRTVRAALVDAARQGGMELYALPAAVQWGERYCRVRDIADALDLPAG